MKKRLFKFKFQFMAMFLILFMMLNSTGDSLVEVYKTMQVSSIYIKTNRDKIVVDAKMNPITVIKYKNGTEENIQNMKYTTSDEEILEVTEEGIVAKKQGEATIKANYLNKKAEHGLEVTDKKDFEKMIQENHKVTFNWRKDNDIVKFWWSGADELKKFSISKKSGDSDLKEVAKNNVGNEFEDKLEDLTKSYEYKVYLLNEYGVSFEVKTINITPDESLDNKEKSDGSITDYKPIDISKNQGQEQEYSIKNEKDITSVRNYKEDETYGIGESFKIDKENINKKIKIKYNYADESLINEDNLKVTMKDEDKKYIVLQQEQIINKEENTITFSSSSEGIYEIKDIIRDKENIREIEKSKTEEETAKEFLANKDKSTMDVLVDCVFKVDKDYLEENKWNLKLNYLSENKSTDLKKLGLYKLLENNKFTLIEEAVFDENKNKLTAKDIKEGLYVIKEKDKVENTKITNIDKVEGKKSVVNAFNLALDGILNKDIKDIKYYETVDFKNIIRGENGIYIIEKDREYLLKVINSYTNNQYKINTDGFLEKLIMKI